MACAAAASAVGKVDVAEQVRRWEGKGEEVVREKLGGEGLCCETSMVAEPGPQADGHGEVVVTGSQEVQEVQEQEGVGQVPVPQAQTVEEKVEEPQVQMQERIAEVPQTQTVEKTMEVPSSNSQASR